MLITEQDANEVQLEPHQTRDAGVCVVETRIQGQQHTGSVQKQREQLCHGGFGVSLFYTSKKAEWLNSASLVAMP